MSEDTFVGCWRFHKAQCVAHSLLERAKGLLRVTEWDEDSRGFTFCHHCGNWQTDGHAPDCELAAFLQDSGEGYSPTSIGREALAAREDAGQEGREE
jgi:hypothetical protein